MAEPINHGIVSGAATGAWETVKGAMKGAAVPILLGALVIGGLAYAGAAMIAAGGVGGAISWIAGLSVPAKIGIVAAGVGAWVGGGFSAIGAAIGGVMGLVKGHNRVAGESRAYQQAVENRALAGMSKVQYAQAVGQQQGYVAGVQAGQQSIVDQLQHVRYAAMAEKMGPCPEKSFREAEDKRRAEAAAITQPGRA